MSTFRVFVALRHGFLTAVMNYGFYYRNSYHAILDCRYDIALFKSCKKIFQESKKFRFNITCYSGSELRTFAFKSALHADHYICAVSLCFWDSSSNWCKALFSLFFSILFNFTKPCNGNFIFVVPCIVILGWRNPTSCNSMQTFIYC